MLVTTLNIVIIITNCYHFPMKSNDSLATMIHELSLLVSRVFNLETKDIGLTRTQWMVLYRLYLDGEQSQSEIATKLSIAKQPLGKVIEKLESEGWVKRKRNPQDKRAYRVSLADKVTPLVPSLAKAVGSIDRLSLKGMNQSDREQLLTHLELVRDNLKNVLSG
jgi:MarR family transcriptional regulator for hemolysin